MSLNKALAEKLDQLFSDPNLRPFKKIKGSGPELRRYLKEPLKELHAADLLTTEELNFLTHASMQEEGKYRNSITNWLADT